MQLISLIMIQALAACLANDMQLEGLMRMENEFIKVLKENQKIHLPEKQKDEYPQKSTKLLYETTGDFLPNKTKELFDYVDHVLKKAKKTLKHLGEYIRTDMKLEGDLTHLIDNIIEEFKIKLNEYLSVVCSEKTKYEIDEEIVFLDVVETANRFLYRKGNKLLNDIALEINDTTKVADFQLITKKLHKDSVTNKKEEMAFVCSNYRVCRSYPSFTDYSADFISEILKMPASKLNIIIRVLRNILESHRSFFKTIIRDEDEKLIVHEIESLLENSASIKKVLLVLRAVMTQRFKIVHNSNPMLKAKTKAVRLLLDIIDKALFSEDEDTLSIDFSNTIQGMKFWVGGQRNDIFDLLNKFIDYIIKSLTFEFTKNTRTEVKTLVEVILRGKTDSDVYEYMDKFGSKFVKGEDARFSNDLY